MGCDDFLEIFSFRVRKVAEKLGGYGGETKYFPVTLYQLELGQLPPKR